MSSSAFSSSDNGALEQCFVARFVAGSRGKSLGLDKVRRGPTWAAFQEECGDKTKTSGFGAVSMIDSPTLPSRNRVILLPQPGSAPSGESGTLFQTPKKRLWL